VEPEAVIKTSATIRLAIGAGAWLTPRLAGRAFGLDVPGNPQSPYLARLFGVRDVALGLGTLQSTGAARRQWLQAGLICDVADAAAAVMAGRRGYLSPLTATLVFAPAVLGIAMGAKALREPLAES
jgi:hypothetical protein